jgi:hypothetical protein
MDTKLKSLILTHLRAAQQSYQIQLDCSQSMDKQDSIQKNIDKTIYESKIESVRETIKQLEMD